jgi:hypothetical protein
MIGGKAGSTASARLTEDEEAIAVQPGPGRTGQIVIGAHEHVWRTRSRHPTSDGALSYQHCHCGQWRLLLGSDHVLATTGSASTAVSDRPTEIRAGHADHAHHSRPYGLRADHVG